MISLSQSNDGERHAEGIEVLSQLQAIFTKHGAIYRNICYVSDGLNTSVEIVAPDKEFVIYIPENLLLPLKDVRLDGEAPQVCSTGLPEELAEAWTRLLTYVLSADRVAALGNWLTGFVKLPQPIQVKLAQIGLHQISMDSLPTQLLKARTLVIRRQPYLLPLLDFVNHSPSGIGFIQGGDGGVGLMGKARREVFARYNPGDVWQIMNTFHYVGETDLAYSIICHLNIPGKKRVVITRSFSEVLREESRPLALLDHEKGRVLEHVLLADVKDPAKARRLFNSALSGSDLAGSADKLFDVLLKANADYYSGLKLELDRHQVEENHPLRKGITAQMRLIRPQG